MNTPTMPEDVDDKRDYKVRGRNKNKTFRFHPDHPWAETHIQQLRSKHVIPMRVGNSRPPYPKQKRNETEESFNNRRNRFLNYYCCLLVPWGNGDKVHNELHPWNQVNEQWNRAHTWDGFCAMVKTWNEDYVDNLNGHFHAENNCPCESSPCDTCLTYKKMHNIFRWNIYHNVARGMCTDPKERELQLRHRARNTEPWHKLPPDAVPAIVRRAPQRNGEAVTAAKMAQENEVGFLNKAAQNRYLKTYLYQQLLEGNVHFLETVATPTVRKGHLKPADHIHRHTCEWAKTTLELLKSTSHSNIAMPEPKSNDNTSAYSASITHPPKLLHSYPDQARIFKYAMTKLTTGTQLLLMIHGLPGCGKTFLLKLIVDRVLTRLNFGVQGCSFQGIAASLMRIGTKTGETMHAMFSMNIRINKKSKRNHVKSLFPLLENVRLLIIDEISMTVSKFMFSIIYYVFR